MILLCYHVKAHFPLDTGEEKRNGGDEIKKL